MLIEIAAVIETLLFTCTWIKRKRAQRWQLFMGKANSVSLPILDDHLRRQTTGASRTEVYAASQLAAVCRKAVQAQAFESLLIHGIRYARNRKHSTTSNWRITL